MSLGLIFRILKKITYNDQGILAAINYLLMLFVNEPIEVMQDMVTQCFSALEISIAYTKRL